MLRIPSKQGGCRLKIFSCQSSRPSEILAARSCHDNILGHAVKAMPFPCAAAPRRVEKCATTARIEVDGKRREGLRKGKRCRKWAGLGPQLENQPQNVDTVRWPSRRGRSSGGKAPLLLHFSPRQTFFQPPLKAKIRKRKLMASHFYLFAFVAYSPSPSLSTRLLDVSVNGSISIHANS